MQVITLACIKWNSAVIHSSSDFFFLRRVLHVQVLRVKKMRVKTMRVKKMWLINVKQQQ